MLFPSSGREPQRENRQSRCEASLSRSMRYGEYRYHEIPTAYLVGIERSVLLHSSVGFAMPSTGSEMELATDERILTGVSCGYRLRSIAGQFWIT
jgi:hypothetical protein